MGTGRPPPGSSSIALCAVLGLVLAGVLWLVWRPTTDECDLVGQCLGETFGALLATLLAIPVAAVALWFLRVRPALLTSLVGVGIGGLLILTVSQLVDVPGDVTTTLAPGWAWLMVGAFSGAVAFLILGPVRGQRASAAR